MIDQYSISNEYIEIMTFNKISTEKEVTVINGKELEIENNFDINLSFGQVSGFKVGVNIIIYIFIGYSIQILNKYKKIIMIVNLIKGGELVEEEAVCTAKETVDPKDGKQLPVELKCKIENVENANQ